MRSVCVFCGANAGRRPAYAAAARAVGALLASRGIELVYGGGRVGLMGVVADAALGGGGRVTGVIPRSLLEKEVGHAGLTELLVVDSMHERKARMAERADAFVALPGGYGTFEELCEVVTWSQLGLHPKACGLLDVEGYYDPLLALFDRAVEEGFVRREHREIVIVERDPEALLDRLARHRPTHSEKWIARGEE